jgi:hypothetical protein
MKLLDKSVECLQSALNANGWLKVGSEVISGKRGMITEKVKESGRNRPRIRASYLESFTDGTILMGKDATLPIEDVLK